MYGCFLENKGWRIKLTCVPKLNIIGLIVFITKIITEENGMAAGTSVRNISVRLMVVVWTHQIQYLEFF